GAVVTLALWRGSAEGPQAAADTVVLTALAALVATWAVRESRLVMRSFSDPSPRFTRRFLVRGTVEASTAREERDVTVPATTHPPPPLSTGSGVVAHRGAPAELPVLTRVAHLHALGEGADALALDNRLAQ